MKKSENMDTFDAKDVRSWFFGQTSREQAEKLLNSESENGVFLVRASSTRLGYVLSVKMVDSVRHYIIEKLETSTKDIIYKSGENLFQSMPDLLEYFKEYPLEDHYKTTLIRPTQIRIHSVRLPSDNLLRISQLPIEAIVVTAYNSTAYEFDALDLEVGQNILVTDINPNGRWKGITEDGTRDGYFPSAHVRLITYRCSDLISFEE